MYLEEHYQSYRAAVAADTMPGYVEYAARTPTAKPEEYPTVLDYLKSTTSCLALAVSNRDVKQYYEYLNYHQEACLMLFKRMFDEKLDHSKDLTIATLDLVHTFGWRSFKYADVVLSFDKFNVIPRYCAKMRPYMEAEVPCLNADEMASIMRREPSPEEAEQLLAEKARNGVFITEDACGLTSVPFSIRNSDVVRDWTGRLH